MQCILATSREMPFCAALDSIIEIQLNSKNSIEINQKFSRKRVVRKQMKLFAIFSIEICQFYHKQMTKSWSLDFTTEISSEFTLNFRERSPLACRKWGYSLHGN